MSVLVGEVWVAMRPQMTSFGSDVKKELQKIINPSGQAGIGGLLNKVGALTTAALIGATVASAKLAIDMEESQARLQGTMGVSAQQAANIGKGFLGTAGNATFSANQILSAFAPVGGQLKIVNGGILTVKQSVDFMNTSMQLADATNLDLTGSTSALGTVLQAFQMGLHGAGDAANYLFTTSNATAVPVNLLAKSLAMLHMKLGDLDPSLKGVSSLMVDLAQRGTVGSRGIRIISGGLEHLIDAAAKSPTAVHAAVASAEAAYTSAQQAVARAQEHLAQKRIVIQQSGGVSDASQQFELVNASQAVADAQNKAAIAAKNLQAAQTGNQLTSSSATATLTKLHVSLYNANHQFIGMRALIGELQPKLAKLHGAQLQLALSNLFGAGAAQQMDKIIKGGTKDFDIATATVTRHNAVNKAAAAYQKTLAGQMRELRATIADLATDFGTLLLPALHDLAGVLAHVTAFFIHNKGAAELLGIVIGTILGAAVLHYVGSVSVKFAKAIEGDIQGLLKLGKTAIGAGEKVQGSSVHFDEAANRWKTSEGKFVSASHAAEIQAEEQAAVTEESADKEVAASDRVVVSMGKQVLAWIKGTIQAAANAGKQAALWVASSAKTAGTWVAQTAQAAAQAAKQAALWAASAAKTIASWVATTAAATANAARQAAIWAVGAARTAATWAAQAASAVASAAVATGAWLASAAQTVASWAAMAAEAVTDAAVQVGAWAAVAAAAVAAFVAENAATLGIAAGIALLVAAIVWMALHWRQTWAAMKDAALIIWHFIDNDIIHPIEAGFHWLVSEIKAHWDLLLPIFLGPIGAILLIWKHFHTQIVNGILSVFHWFENLPDMILKAVEGFGKLLLKAGIELMKGLVHGIEHGLDLVRHTIAHVADNVVGWVTSGFGIFSPSRVFAGIGERLMEGLAKGVKDGSHVAKDAVQHIDLGKVKFDSKRFVDELKTGQNAYIEFANRLDKKTQDLAACFLDFGETTRKTLGILPELMEHVSSASVKMGTALDALYHVTGPTVNANAGGGTNTTEQQMLVTMRAQILATKANTEAVKQLTEEERRPVKAVVHKHGGKRKGGDHDLSLSLAR